jgi:hypothetical protein
MPLKQPKSPGGFIQAGHGHLMKALVQNVKVDLGPEARQNFSAAFAENLDVRLGR